ncbi:hypothetical protein [Rickettsia koreansis]|uniref:hypothetical protein n=1 Tax=Rickettsia koreansis TaxID=2358204 RepID=UPI00397D2CC9
MSNNNIFRSIMLIKKYYFYKLLEKNFAHLTSIKAKYALEFKVGPIITKNINYTNKIIIFFVVFIATLIYLPVLFHVANNISYCLQNILKSLLCIRAVRESHSVGLHGLKSVFGVIPWFDHGIQKIIKNTNISIFNWIPRSSCGMTEVESLHKTSNTKNHSVESQKLIIQKIS